MTVIAESAVSTRYAFNVALGELLLAVKAVEPAISKNPAVPVLAGVLLTGRGAGVEVGAFDYEKSARYELDGVGEGRVLLPFATLKALLVGAGKRATKRVSDGWTVTVAPGDNGCAAVVVNGAATALGELPLDEYPELPPAMGEPWIEVDTPELLRAVAAAMVSVSKDATLPVLTGVSLVMDGGRLELFSTDRYRLTQATVPVKSAAAWSALVPGLTLKAWSRQLDKGAGTRIAVAADGGLLWLSNGRASYSTMLVDGNYPKIRSLFPDSCAHEFVIDTAALLGAVASLAPLAVRNTPIRLQLGDTLALEVMVDETGGSSSAALGVLDRDGDPVTVAFNPRFLLELLKDFKTGEVVVSVTHPAKPALFRAAGEGSPADSVKHLLMPVRLPNN